MTQDGPMTINLISDRADGQIGPEHIHRQ